MALVRQRREGGQGGGRYRVPVAWWGAVPSLALLAIFVLYPLLQVLHFSTLRWDGVAPGVAVGLGNYGRMLADPDLGRSLVATAFFALLTLPAFVVLSAAVAVELEGSRFERPLKALFFLPGLWTVAASAIGWYTLYAPDYGILATVTNGVLALPWGSEGWAALVIIALFTIWQHVGYGILVVSAGLKSIPPEVVEAARVDGASESQLRRRVILPLLRPSLVFLGVVGSIYALQSYTAVFLLTRGGPFGATRVVGYFLYETAFERFELGYAAALSVLVLV
ncbi:MAG TPA: sugar ABC transporter permease, partial [Deinococcales bacterium]|nr:sugar ABC transporter permease [Deinococcales bacterium]